MIEILEQVSTVEVISPAVIEINQSENVLEIASPSVIGPGNLSDPLFSVEFDLDALGSATIAIAAGTTAWPNQVGVFVTQLDGTLTSQPTLSIGVTGSLTKYRNNILSTSLGTLNDRETIDVGTSDDGNNGITDTNFVLTVDTAGIKNTATVYRGKFFMIGMQST